MRASQGIGGLSNLLIGASKNMGSEYKYNRNSLILLSANLENLNFRGVSDIVVMSYCIFILTHADFILRCIFGQQVIYSMDTYLKTDESLYMSGMLDDLRNISAWVRKGRCSIADYIEGYSVVDDVDGTILADREVSFVSILPDKYLPPHMHRHSDTYFVIVSGRAKINLGDESMIVKTGSQVKVPRGVPHGFNVGADGLEFISIQNPPIRDRVTGETDFISIEQGD